MRADTRYSYRLFIILAVLLLTLTFTGIGGWLLNLHDSQTRMELDHSAQQLKTAYEASQAELEHQLAALAQDLASDREVRRLLSLAKQTPPEEFSLLHERLKRHLNPRWQNLHKSFDTRQMQVLLPGSISFLRLHAPDDYGDSLKGVRHLLDEVERTRLPQSGFETGRAFSGLRGAAPVLENSPDGAEKYLGAVEVGIHFDGHIARIGKQTGVGYGVLLNTGQATEIMWQEKRPVMSSPGSPPCCLLLTASSGELHDWLANTRLPRHHGPADASLIKDQGRTFQFIHFPLAEFRSKLETAPPIGSIVIWREITETMAAYHRHLGQTLFYLSAAYLLSLAIFAALLRFSRREWQQQLTAQADELARLSRQKAVLLETLGEGVYGTNSDGCCTFVNKEALRMLGYSREEVIGQNQHAIFHHHRPDGSPYPHLECPIYHTLQDGRFRSREEWLIRKNGEGFPVRLTVAAVEENGQPGGAVVVFRDITRQKEREKELLHLATTDPLTGVANRRRFLELLAQEIKRTKRSGGPSALMMLDLDLFKLVNDNYGHAVGDLVLQRFAALIRQTLRQIDSIGRLGGEEFAVILPDSDLAAALEAGERLRQALEAETIQCDTSKIHITTSIGLTPLHPDDETPDKSLSRADEALYAAKYLGRNRVESRA